MNNTQLENLNTSLSCALSIEWYNLSGAVNKSLSLKTATISIVRNEFRELHLSIQSKQSFHKFSLKNVSVHKKFMHEGKASVKFIDLNLTVLLSNAPTTMLAAFLKVLFIKLTSSKSSPKTSVRNMLLSVKQHTVEEVSPINSKDINRTKQHVTSKVNSKPCDSKKRPLFDGQVPKESKKVCLSSLMSLNAEQQVVCDTVMRGHNIFFTGSAGTGKSHLLRAIINSLPPEATVATASTGAAACLIGGITLHSFAGIGTGEEAFERCLTMASRPMTSQNWKKCQHLIIDEISMVDATFFEKLERIAREVRGNSKVFGGIQLILCGDFLQLPPVSRSGQRRFCFNTDAWHRCKFLTFNLKQVHRQADPNFVKILNSIRVGRVTVEIKEALQRTATQEIESGGVLATRLCSHTNEAETINKTKLQQLSSPLKYFSAIDCPVTASKILDDCTPVSKEVILKEGAQVMLLKNINVSKGLVNGARGIITKFVNDDPVVKLVTGEEYQVKMEKWVVKGASGNTFSRKQVPLRLAWAFSIHKSQGLTLDCVEMSLNKIFEAGQAYVALSRARSLDGLRVIGFQESQVWADPDVLRFYKNMNTYQPEFIALGKGKLSLPRTKSLEETRSRSALPSSLTAKSVKPKPSLKPKCLSTIF